MEQPDCYDKQEKQQTSVPDQAIDEGYPPSVGNIEVAPITLAGAFKASAQ